MSGSKETEILRAIATMAAGGGSLLFEEDYGYGTATITLNGGHTHVGTDHGSREENFQAFIDGLHALLIEGRGLSIVRGHGVSQ